jgi:hypothetical protein
MNNGEITAEIGSILKKILRSKFSVFFDHGDTSKSRNVKACQALLSDEPKNATRVADVDIVICHKMSSSHQSVVAIIEVEESSFSPKTILGDIFSLMLAKTIAVKRDDGGHDIYKIEEDTSKYVFGVVKSKGSKLKQIKNYLFPALSQALGENIYNKIPMVTVLNEYDDLRSEVVKVVTDNILIS